MADSEPTNGAGFDLEIAAMRKLLARSLRHGDTNGATRCCRTIGELQERAARMTVVRDPERYASIIGELLRESGEAAERDFMPEDPDVAEDDNEHK